MVDSSLECQKLLPFERMKIDEWLERKGKEWH
jgi:hypothetical protein